MLAAQVRAEAKGRAEGEAKAMKTVAKTMLERGKLIYLNCLLFPKTSSATYIDYLLLYFI